MNSSHEPEKKNVVIVGGGPAGISAAIWCADLGMSSVILEREAGLYGQLHRVHNPITNYPGISAKNGSEFIKFFERSAVEWGVQSELNAHVTSIDCDSRTVRIADGRVFVGDVFFIATGVRRGTLGVPGEKEFSGRGILDSGAGERESVKGKRVVVVGGGDAAAENALILAEHAENVYLVHRRHELTARPEFRERIAAAPNIEFLPETAILSIGGKGRVEFVEAASNGESIRIDTDYFIARIGVAPNSELVASQLRLDPRGYIEVDGESRTSAESVYAIGDVANPVSPTISTAAGTGATAAKSAFALLTQTKTV